MDKKILRCVAIDDEPLALKLLQEYAFRTPLLHMIQVFEDAISGLEFLKTAQIDVLFADINMPDISGIDLVRNLEHKPLIIFTTAYKKFAYEGFELDAADYLLKPIDYDRFYRSVLKAVAKHQQNSLPTTAEFLFVRSEYRMIKIDISSIDYIEGLEDYIRIHIEHAKPALTLMTLKAVLEKLPAGKFLRIHRSYIVPLSKVGTIVNKRVTLTTGKELPVGESYADHVNEWMYKPL